MSFRESVFEDIKNVFLNEQEYGEPRTILYDGETYEDVPVVISGLKEKDRNATAADHAQGLYLVSSVMHCSLKDMRNKQPERGQRIKISDPDGKFYRAFFIAQSDCEMGMLRIELEAIDE